MPELPDLEVFKTNIFNQLTSKRLIDVEVFNHKKVHIPVESPISNLADMDLLCINRNGKELFFDFGNQNVVAVHLMLNGKISIVDGETANIVKSKIFSMRFEQETIVFSDWRGLCTIKYMPLVDKIPDAFDDTFTLEYFLGIAYKKHRKNIKAFIVDQNIVKGIGNAYADEILWVARISPHSLVGKVPEDKLIVLYHAINTVLNDAIASIKHIAPNIISGEKRKFLKVHNKTLKKTETGYPIIKEVIASRTTYYTEEQIYYL